MDLEIRVIRKKPEIYNNFPGYEGRIVIKKFWEDFNICVEHWSLDDYKRQWKEGLERIKHENVSCLVSSIQDPSYAPLLHWWLLYKENENIFIQNRMCVDELYESRIKGIFTSKNCYDYIPPRYIPSSAKDIVAEWSVDVWW